ncbi:restriction endonuclease subunit S [Streptococcus agalactiae]|uniref:restriction endonuclease subunit S n=1 Tax=Streptococcus agalactiae TaxID=1311 RepID=UPI00085C3398|nr:restriction endonuclease subunit S [Streptococcus agalactiae]
MTEWKKVRLGDLCKNVYSGGTPKKSITEYYDGSIFWLNTKEINFNRIYETEKTISEKGLANSSAKYIPENTVVVAMYGTTAGKVAIAKNEMTTNQACCNLIIDETKADYNFVYYSIAHNYKKLSSLANGGAQQNLNAGIIKDFEISLPPLSIQKEIASILIPLDDKIENNKKINHHLEELIDAQFAHLLEDNELYKSTFSEIGEIVGGGTPSKKVDDYWNGDIPWLSPKDLSLNPAMFTGRGQNSITELGYKKSSAKLMPRNSILFSSRAPIGYITIAENDISTNQGFKSIIPKPEYPYTFVYELLKQETPSLESSASGSTFKEVSGTHLKNHEIRIPPHSAIIKFHESVEPLFKTINLNEKEIQKLIEVRDLLLPTLMSGEISVSD